MGASLIRKSDDRHSKINDENENRSHREWKNSNYATATQLVTPTTNNSWQIIEKVAASVSPNVKPAQPSAFRLTSHFLALRSRSAAEAVPIAGLTHRSVNAISKELKTGLNIYRMIDFEPV